MADSKDADWQRLVRAVRDQRVSMYTHFVEVPEPPEPPPKQKRFGGYTSREMALARQQAKYREYEAKIARGEVNEDVPSRQGFATWQGWSRTTFWRVYSSKVGWGLPFPPTLEDTA